MHVSMNWADALLRLIISYVSSTLILAIFSMLQSAMATSNRSFPAMFAAQQELRSVLTPDLQLGKLLHGLQGHSYSISEKQLANLHFRWQQAVGGFGKAAKHVAATIVDIFAVTPVAEAFSAFSTSATAVLLMTNSPAATRHVLSVPFALTWFVYSYDRLKDSSTDAAAPGRKAALARLRWVLVSSFAASAGYLLLWAAQMQRSTLLTLAVIAFTSVVYTPKFIPTLDRSGKLRLVNLKAIPCAKTAVVAAAWGIGGTALAQQLLQEAGITCIHAGARNFFGLIAFISVGWGTVSSDIRDYSEDLKAGVRTPATVFGLFWASVIGEVLVVAASLLCLAAWWQQQPEVDFVVAGLQFTITQSAVGLIPTLIGYLILGLVCPHVVIGRSGYCEIAEGSKASLERLCFLHHVPFWPMALCVYFVMPVAS